MQTNLLIQGLILGSWSIAALLLYPLIPRRAGLRLGRVMVARIYGLFWRIVTFSGMMRLDAQALDSLRDEDRLVLVANHPSMLDAVLLAARLPRSFCVMKASLMRNPFLGPGARLARYVRNDSALGMVRCAVRELQDGGQLLLFPEGTRTTEPPVNKFHASFAVIARRAKVPVQTVIIETNSPYLSKGWPLWRLPPLPVCFVVRLGRRFDPLAATDADSLSKEVHAYFVDELGADARTGHATQSAEAAGQGP